MTGAACLVAKEREVFSLGVRSTFPGNGPLPMVAHLWGKFYVKTCAHKGLAEVRPSGGKKREEFWWAQKLLWRVRVLRDPSERRHCPCPERWVFRIGGISVILRESP